MGREFTEDELTDNVYMGICGDAGSKSLSTFAGVASIETLRSVLGSGGSSSEKVLRFYFDDNDGTLSTNIIKNSTELTPVITRPVETVIRVTFPQSIGVRDGASSIHPQVDIAICWDNYGFGGEWYYYTSGTGTELTVIDLEFTGGNQ